MMNNSIHSNPKNTHPVRDFLIATGILTVASLALIEHISSGVSRSINDTLDIKVTKPLNIGDGQAISMEFTVGDKYEVLIHENGPQVYYEGRRMY